MSPIHHRMPLVLCRERVAPWLREPQEAMEEREKRYVPVIVRFEADGKLRPLEIEFDEAHRYPVDKILDVRRAACQSVGGVGDRYTCRIQGKESYLWFEKGRWFVAAKR